MPYEFRDGNSYKNDDFKKGGLLSVLEYNTSKKGNGSYLATGREYWTLSKNNSNQYYIDNILLDKNPSDNSGIRVTQFVKPSVNVTGKGTYVNPWVFREQFSVQARSSSNTYGTVSPSEQMVDGGTRAKLVIKPITGYMYSGSDCSISKKSATNYETAPVKKDLICTINFEIRKIKINYSCTGGSGSISSQTVKYNDPYTIADYTHCTKTGYTQKGWKTSDGTAWTPSSVKNRTFKASCTKDTYKITLDANGCGTGGSSAVYEKYSTGVYRNSGLTKAMTTSEYPITPPSKSGSEFTGYYTTKSGGTQLIDADGFRKTSNFTKTYFDSNATIYAHCKTHTTHVWRAIGSSTFKTSKWCLGNAGPCPSGHSRTYAHSVYCTKCGMSADYYKWNTDNGHVTHPNATTPSRVERKCYNGPSPAGKDGWIRVNDSDLDSWSDVHNHAYVRFGQVNFKDIDGYSCTYSY